MCWENKESYTHKDSQSNYCLNFFVQDVQVQQGLEKKDAMVFKECPA